MSGCHAARLRCPICGNPDWHDRGGPEECTHCGLAVADADALASAREEIGARLGGGRAEARAGDRWALSAGAWRNAAWALGFVTTDGAAAPATPVAAEATLAVMARPADLAAVSTLVEEVGGRFARVLVALDADDGGTCVPAGIELLRHPLAGDFAAQRNRLQAAAGDGWVLQIDSDERPTAALLDALGWITAAADRDGIVSLGLPRINLVDGARSALFPDIQYRLNRAETRFSGRVHERPVVPFARTSLALAGAIEHRLDGVRVRERTRIYGAMAADGARREDEAKLLRPFDAIADR